MTSETLKEAKSIETELNKVRDIISHLQYHVERVMNERKNVKNGHKPAIPNGNGGWDWKLDLWNLGKDGKSNSDEQQQATIIVFDAISNYGTSLVVEEELITLIKGYYKDKEKQLEDRFERLGDPKHTAEVDAILESIVKDCN